MKPARPALFWIVAIAAIACTVALLREALLPFLAGLILAYLVLPLVARLERIGVPRAVSSLALILLFGAAIVSVLVLATPILLSELTYFLEKLPGYFESLRTIATRGDHAWLNKILGDGFANAQRSVNQIMQLAGESFGEFLTSLWSGGRAFFALFSLAIVSPVIAFYLVRDWRKIIHVIKKWVPAQHQKVFLTLAVDIDRTISGFIQGQALLCLALALYYAAALSAIGLNHAILIGVFAGLISFVPYLGSMAGIVIATCVAIAQFWPSLTPILSAPAIFIVGQTVGDYVLSPYLIGQRIHLSPVWVLFALFAFGYLFGFLGLLVAVPLAAAIGVVVRFAAEQYFRDTPEAARVNEAP
ncbi:putative PurR-regulated permease PerM [Rhodoblastus acidophilus]|uniref:AI-2E family transporter n=1 Tax=Rhodoblastus acidophilus TaxID=1074 RepID=UPI0022249FD8|nr:AI-2E family transporter [Rhodoblastus acidophilus]MCW2282613.1 putative PurR-regulated permease PerM [Rhodoblastus acidophilus]MCW2331474.1 putative PurR-regulated permease PerM [Rhodoblastus acidophilus]